MRLKPAPLVTLHLRGDERVVARTPHGPTVALPRDLVVRWLTGAGRRIDRSALAQAGLFVADRDAADDDAFAELRRPLPPRVFAWLQRHGALARGTRAADLGCGTGRMAVALARAGATVTACDASTTALARTRAAAIAAGVDVRTELADVEALPWPSESFDLVVLDQVLPFVRPLVALEEAARVLASGGALSIVETEVITALPWTVPRLPWRSTAAVLRALGWSDIEVSNTRDRVRVDVRTYLAAAERSGDVPRSWTRVARQLLRHDPDGSMVEQRRIRVTLARR